MIEEQIEELEKIVAPCNVLLVIDSAQPLQSSGSFMD